ncbi:MAG: hypothetical protein PHV36_06085 [Elusimicrobiales bacterium]|nr:hypothetical protein [Elusimicrobiales bacterium]
MKPENFVESVVDAYRAARIPIVPHPKISRGESRSIASEIEDRLAHYLITSIPGLDHIFINQTLTSIHKGTDARIKPDLVVCLDGKIRLLIDLKMDLGYNRNGFPDSIKKADAIAAEFQGQTVSMWQKVGHKRKRLEKTFSDNLKYVFFVISDQNINPKLFAAAGLAASQLKNTALLVLLPGIHPNEYGKSRAEAIKDVMEHIDPSVFSKLESFILST